MKAEQAEEVAKKATADAETARMKARQYTPGSSQPGELMDRGNQRVLMNVHSSNKSMSVISCMHVLKCLLVSWYKCQYAWDKCMDY